MKKIAFTLLTLTVFTILAFRVDFQRNGKGGCAFCQKEILERQVFYKGNGALGLLTHKPAVPGHVLIIPERHVERFEDMTAEEMVAIGEAIKKIDVAVRRTFGNTDYLLVQKNGRGAGQSVPHVHFHYLPATKYLAIRFFVSPWLKALNSDELKLLNQALSEQF